MDPMKNEKTVHTLFRVLFSLIFVLAGVQHVVATAKVAERLSHSSFAPLLTQFMPLETHVFLAGLVLLLGGLGLMLGAWTQKASLLLFSVLIPITITAQLGGEESMGPLFKNIALMGGLLYFSYFGTQGWKLETRFQNARAKLSMGFVPMALVIALAFGLKISRKEASLLPSANAATSSEKPNKASSKQLAVLVREAKHLQIAVKTAQKGLKGADGLTLSSAKIVVCGKPGVESLKIGSSIEKTLQEAQQSGIEIAACGLSLKEAGLTQEQLVKTVQVVENGLWEMIRLQNQGAISIEL